MAIREMRARTLLAHVRQPDTWFGLRYNMNLYRGCEHQCIYCDSRSACYQIENFRDVLVKVNAIELLRDALARKRTRGTVGFGSMSDPYGPVERKYTLTRQALGVLATFGFPAHIITKSALPVRDIDVLQAVNARTFALVSFSITTADDDLARRLEPGAARPSERFAAMQQLAAAGIHTGVVLMPVLPFLEDNAENIAQIVDAAAAHGAEFVLPAFGVTLRDRQRVYFYHKLDKHFPGVRERYEARFGERYSCDAREAGHLAALCARLCTQHGLAQQIPRWSPPPVPQQLSLL